MGTVSVLVLMALALYAALAAVTALQGLRDRARLLFFALMLGVAGHGACHLLTFEARDADAAWRWFQASAAFWPAVMPVQLLLVMELAGVRLPRPRATVPLVFLPVGIAVAAMLLAGSPGPADMVATPGGYTRDLSRVPWLGPAVSATILGYFGAALVLLVAWARKVRTRRQRRQAAWLVGTGLACMAITLAWLALVPVGESPQGPRPTQVFAAVYAVGWAVAILRYRMLSPTPALAAVPILQAMQELVLLTDPDGTVRVASARASGLLGRAPADLEGRPAAAAVTPPEPLVAALEAARKAPPGAPPESCETGLRAADGQEIPARLSVAAVRDPEGDPVGLVVVAQDLRPLREMLKAERIDSIGQLAGGIAHDFNNLLMAVGGYVALASLDVPEGGEARRRLEEAGRAVQRAQGLTRQLLTFSRGGAPVIRATSLREVLGDTASFVVSGSPVRLVLDVPPDLWWVDGDEGQIAQVLHNLALNAVQAMAGGGTLRLSARNLPAAPGLAAGPAGGPGDRVRIEVSDTGPGIPPDLQERIFEPFYTTKPGGSGLGLASVHSIVRRHGGTVAVESRPGGGARFCVDLPRARGPAAAPSRSEALRPLRGIGSVLVMDDQPEVRRVAAEMLEHLGYRVDRCADGDEAVRLHREALEAGRPYDVVLLDLTVPGGLGGQEALVRMRALQPGTKAVVASGYAADAALAEWRAAGFDGVLPKPYTLDRLQAVLEAVLGRTASPWPALTGTGTTPAGQA